MTLGSCVDQDGTKTLEETTTCAHSIYHKSHLARSASSEWTGVVFLFCLQDTILQLPLRCALPITSFHKKIQQQWSQDETNFCRDNVIISWLIERFCAQNSWKSHDCTHTLSTKAVRTRLAQVYLAWARWRDDEMIVAKRTYTCTMFCVLAELCILGDQNTLRIDNDY